MLPQRHPATVCELLVVSHVPQDKTNRRLGRRVIAVVCAIRERVAQTVYTFKTDKVQTWTLVKGRSGLFRDRLSVQMNKSVIIFRICPASLENAQRVIFMMTANTEK